MKTKTRRRLALAALALAASPFADAGTQLVATSPANAQELAAPPIEVRLTFNERVSPRAGSVKLVSAAGKHFDADRPHADKNDPNSIAASVPVLRKGVYHAHWTVVGAEGHRLRGEFSFTVK